MTLALLREKLSWPVECTTGEEALAVFMHHARALVGKVKIFQGPVQKQMTRILIQALPAFFNLTYEDCKEDFPESRDLVTSEQALEKYVAVEDVHIRSRRTTKRNPHQKDPNIRIMSVEVKVSDVGKPKCSRCGSLEQKFRSCPEATRFNCREKGHIARDCPKPKRQRKQETQKLGSQNVTDSEAEHILVQNAKFTHSGARKKIGSLKLQKKFCVTSRKLSPSIVVAWRERTDVKASEVGDIDMRVIVDDFDTVYLRTIKMYMVESDDWKDLFIEFENLKKLQVLPEQVISRLPMELRNNKPEDVPDIDQKEIMDKAFNKMAEELNLPFHGSIKSKGRMSNLEPIDCTLKKTVSDSFKVKTRLLKTLREDWLRKKAASMVKGGFLKKVASASYTSQVFIVPKKGPAKYQMIVDMRMLSSITQKTAITLLLLDHQLHLCRKSQMFACFDMKNEYDFLRTTENANQYFILLMP
eukprot:augustus_masked-scaffold_7-processed-gene-6.52-mRNA-1 protein AED:1.00 eAED:1.00 QI:0/0/0/0/1/1/4/0/470